jgi:tRNA pseudouridine55 synthase
MLSGIMVIDKPRGMTSGDAVYKLRKLLHERKIGHAGTLDPDVSGVLPIAVGQATKLIDRMHLRPKAYCGSGRLGLATDSYDLEGKILKRQKLTEPVSAEKLKKAMQDLTGHIAQKPPIYSAVRVNGKRLYEYARAGEAVEIPIRQVDVYDYQLTSEPVFNGQEGLEDFAFRVRCGKGTYVRALVNDLGRKLGLPAVMTSLRRTEACGFTLDQSVPLAQLTEENARQYLHPLEEFFADLPQLDLSQQQWGQVKNGAWLHLDRDENELALKYNKKVKAIYRRQGQVYRPALMLLANQ